MRRLALFVLIASVAYFSYPFMQPALSLPENGENPQQTQKVEKGEFIRLVEASSRFRQDAARVAFDYPDPKPEAVFPVTR